MKKNCRRQIKYGLEEAFIIEQSNRKVKYKK